MSLTRNQQLFIRVENQPAVPNSLANLFATDYGVYLGINASLDYEVERIKRDVKRSTLTPAQDLAGKKTAKAKFGLEVCGWNGAIASIGPSPYVGRYSQLDIPLRACGLRGERLSKLTIPASGAGAVITNIPFVHGETVTQATSLATATVVMDTSKGKTTLWIARNNGLGNAAAFNTTDVVTGATSGATCTPSAVTTQAGCGYWPLTDETYELNLVTGVGAGTLLAVGAGDLIIGNTSGATAIITVGYGIDTATALLQVRPIAGTFVGAETINKIATVGGGLVGTLLTPPMTYRDLPTVGIGLTKDATWEAMFGARGTPTMRFPVGGLCLVEFDFTGTVDPTYGNDGAYQDGAKVANVVYPSFVPPIFVQANFKIGPARGDVSTFVAPCTANIEFTMNNTIEERECINAPSGVLGYRITSRAPSLTLDPELQPEAFFAAIGKLLQNTNVAVEWTVKPASAPDGNTFYFQVPTANIQTATTGDRKGVATRALTLQPNTGSSGVGSTTIHDNDIVIVHDFSL